MRPIGVSNIMVYSLQHQFAWSGFHNTKLAPGSVAFADRVDTLRDHAQSIKSRTGTGSHSLPVRAYSLNDILFVEMWLWSPAYGLF